jgi:alanine racemase
MKKKAKTTFAYPAWAEVDLANIAYNYARLKQKAGPSIKMLAAVKADAYGHGMKQVAELLVKSKVDYFGVANIFEAKALRKAKIKTPVLVMGNVYVREQIKAAIKNNITLTAVDLNTAEKYNAVCNKNKKLKVHIKVDTGMGRLGIWHEHAFDQIVKIAKLKNLIIEGIFTHFPSADIDYDFTEKQIKLFEKLIKKLNQNQIKIGLVHAANSIAICRFKNSCLGTFNMARPGIMLYGLYPSEQRNIKLKPVLELKSRIMFIKPVSPGQTISYARTYKIEKPTRIATISIGYADGYLRSLSNKAYVKIRGKLYPVVGRICMDQTMVDIGLKAKLKVGDEVTLIGQDKKKIISTENLASLCETIPYEITCGISPRVKRVFKKY